MATQKAPTEQELRQMQQFQNQSFIANTLEKFVKGDCQNSNTYGAGRTINYLIPTISGAWMQKATVKMELDIFVTKGSGDVVPTQCYPENLVSRMDILFGNKLVNIAPYLTRIFDKLEGYNRVGQSQAHLDENPVITAMINQVPKTFTEGSNKLVFEFTLDLNNIHPASINGLVPMYSNGTKPTVQLTLPSSVASLTADPLETPLFLTGDATATVSGTVDVIATYRDHVSPGSGVTPYQPNIGGIPSVQIIQLPTISNLTPTGFNYGSFRNPYLFSRLVHLVVDSNSNTELASPSNVTGFRYDKAENSSSELFRYDEEVGISTYYRKVRETFGRDMDPGVYFYDAGSMNTANVSSRMGNCYLNLDGSKGGYPAARFGFKLDKVNNDKGVSPRVISFGVLLNDEGIRAI